MPSAVLSLEVSDSSAMTIKTLKCKLKELLFPGKGEIERQDLFYAKEALHH